MTLRAYTLSMTPDVNKKPQTHSRVCARTSGLSLSLSLGFLSRSLPYSFRYFVFQMVKPSPRRRSADRSRYHHHLYHSHHQTNPNVATSSPLEPHPYKLNSTAPQSPSLLALSPPSPTLSPTPLHCHDYGAAIRHHRSYLSFRHCLHLHHIHPCCAPSDYIHPTIPTNFTTFTTASSTASIPAATPPPPFPRAPLPKEPTPLPPPLMVSWEREIAFLVVMTVVYFFFLSVSLSHSVSLSVSLSRALTHDENSGLLPLSVVAFGIFVAVFCSVFFVGFFCKFFSLRFFVRRLCKTSK